MHEVAVEAGVSQTTVSHVINGSRAIAPETEARVWQAVRALGYVNDSVARSLRTGSTSTIGLAISAISNPYFAEVVGAIEQHATARGKSLILVDTHDDPARELQVVSELVGRRCDGIILAPSADPSAALDLVGRHGTPLVLMDRIPALAHDRVDAIGVHNTEPTAQLVDHLALLGHRRVAFVAGLPGLATSDERLAGFHEGVRRNGLDPDPGLVVVGGSDDSTSYAAVSELLTHPERPSAIVAGNNAMTIGALRAVHAQGLRVPDDIGLVGFDDFPWAALFEPRLTVVAQPLTTLGHRAAELLDERIADPSLPPREERLMTSLVVRSSGGHGPATAS